MCEYILDIVQNSVEAKASVITLDLLESDDTIRICIGDNGCGMDEATLGRVTDPFFSDGKKHAHRKVGLGIPFAKQAADAADGEFDISSDPEMGTSVSFSFNKTHVDCPPLGDLPGTFTSVMLFEGQYDLLVYRSNKDASYRVSRGELEESLGDLYDTRSMMLMKQFFLSQEDEVLSGGNNG
ncbi:MAG: ATP-binding protein [Spirochaetota bacterium]